VNEQRVRVEHAQLLEQRDRRRRARCHREPARAMRVGERALALAHEALLRIALGDVHRDAAPRARDEREERIGDRVRRVRRDADLLELGLERIVCRELLREPRRGLAHRARLRRRRERLPDT